MEWHLKQLVDAMFYALQCLLTGLSLNKNQSSIVALNVLIVSSLKSTQKWTFVNQSKLTGGLVPHLRRTKMKSKIIQTLVEWTLAIIIFGGWGVMLAWRG